MKSENEIRREAILDCAREVAGHWNDRSTMTNQYDQAQRSANVLNKMAMDIVLDSSTPAESVCECGHQEKYEMMKNRIESIINELNSVLIACDKFTPVKPSTQDAEKSCESCGNFVAPSKRLYNHTSCERPIDNADDSCIDFNKWIPRQPQSKTVSEKKVTLYDALNEAEYEEFKADIDKRLAELEQFRKETELEVISLAERIEKLESKDTLPLLMPLLDEICRELRWPKLVQSELKKLKDK